MRRGIGWALAVALLAGAGARLAGAAAGDMVRSGGFESEERAGLGRDWASESYGGATVRFDLAAEKPQAGKYCQHIQVTGYQKGGTQIRQRGLALEKGKPYEITLWLRGTVSGPVTVGFRKAEKPYSYYLKEAVKVSPAWQKYTITGTAPDTDADAGLYIFFAGDGELWIDSVSARETSG